jgi:hypothetical protein
VRLAERTAERLPDDRANLRPGEPSLLIVEDDPHYASILADLPVHECLAKVAAFVGTALIGFEDFPRSFHFFGHRGFFQVARPDDFSHLHPPLKSGLSPERRDARGAHKDHPDLDH